MCQELTAATSDSNDGLGLAVDPKKAWKLAHERAEREAAMMVRPGSGPLTRAANVARLEGVYFRQYTQP